jgi:hypothetical protein
MDHGLTPFPWGRMATGEKEVAKGYGLKGEKRRWAELAWACGGGK